MELLRPKKVNNMFLRPFPENGAGLQLFIFYLFLIKFRKILTFTMRSNQSTNKMVGNDGQLKLTIHAV